MKRFISILATAAIMLSFTACGGASQPSNSDNTDTTKDAQSQVSTTVESTLIVGLDDSFPPMGFRDDNNEIVGFDIDLAKAAAEKMGVSIQFQPIDWDSKELELNSGKVDLLWNGLTITEDRKATMAFTDPYLKNKQIILVKNDSEIKVKANLEGKIIGLQNDSSALNAVENDEIKDKIGEIIPYEDNIQAFTDLDIGRIDAVVVDEILARYYLSQNETNFKILEENFGDEVYGIAAKLDNTELISKLQTALNEMSEDGTATEISNKWFNEDIYLHDGKTE